MHPNVQKWLDFEYAPQKSQEWLDLRMGMLTASDAASAIGADRKSTRLNSQSHHDLVCRLLLEKKKKKHKKQQQQQKKKTKNKKK